MSPCGKQDVDNPTSSVIKLLGTQKADGPVDLYLYTLFRLKWNLS